MRTLSSLVRLVLLTSLAVPLCLAQANPIAAEARKAIDAGNQAWVDAMKSGDVAPVAETYAEDALDCGPTGECIRGRAAIGRNLAERSAKRGRANSASVTSGGAVQNGDFVYEWGHAEAAFGSAKLVGRYLTVWRRESDGHWKIFRNMSIPPDQTGTIKTGKR